MFHSSHALPCDFAQLDEGTFYANVMPRPLINPRLAHLNQALADTFGLSSSAFTADNFTHFLAQDRLPEPIQPIAMAYSGHQFGGFNPGLGDGRAMLLADFKDTQGQRWEFQLKGSGPTPYSRGFDGRAVLRSVIREYLASEALHCLGIATTRALCVVASDTPVYREQPETGAMMIRVAPSHLRFGSFEHFYVRQQYDHLKQLADYCIAHHFPACLATQPPYSQWFREVVTRTARMVASWQAVGFCHGVMNTDNFSILGLTFDYGPYGFMERYDPSHICNHSDTEGRYAFERQPSIGLWNCYCLAQALTPLIPREPLEQALDSYDDTLQVHYLKLMREKLGLYDRRDDDENLIAELLELLRTERLDYTRFFRGLAYGCTEGACHPWLYEGQKRPALERWLSRYQQRLQQTADPERRQRMLATNPKFILRNHLAQGAIDQAQKDDFSELEQLMALLTRPFDEHPGFEDYAKPPSESAAHLCVSCSS